MQKTEVYSWRLSPRLKYDLEQAARAEQKSMAELLEEIAQEWLERFRDSDSDDEERQRVLHEAGMKLIGSIHGDGPHRAENARSEVRKRIAERPLKGSRRFSYPHQLCKIVM
jgi:hypothetical protein